MKYVGYTALILMLGLYGFGANAASDNWEQLQQKWAETLESVKSFSADQREQAVANTKEVMEDFDKQINELERWTSEQWHEMSDAAREKRQASLEKLRRQRNELAEWYGAMKHSSSESWEHVKDGFAGAYENLSASFKDAAKEFKDQ